MWPNCPKIWVFKIILKNFVISFNWIWFRICVNMINIIVLLVNSNMKECKENCSSHLMDQVRSNYARNGSKTT